MPGVTVHCAIETELVPANAEEPDIWIALDIQSQKSLAHLTYLITMSNLPSLQVHMQDFPEEVDDLHAINDSGTVRYELRVPAAQLRGDTPNYLQILGIFLARDLKSMKLITPEESDRIQSEWNAVVE